ncbi:multidrug and toxin extrusion protein 2-like [Mixophyes fleayi]|uniref:multidrug and toxin extrusion protein 2-like n=1 Tax=Mixophyes fleayi TaxID=3061075 RepID=UPI003F4E1D1E
MIYLLFIVSAIFCGHLGKIELDSITLAVAVINVTGISVGVGMASACDTLMSQTYGGKNMKRVGVILQRGILILMLCCSPCWAIFINTEQMLLLFKQNPHVARLTQRYVKIILPALPAIFLQQLQTKYLQNQGIMWPPFFVGLIVNVVNAVVNAILLLGLKLGVDGSAWANTISQWAMFLLLFSYIVVKKLHVETWGGWSKDCLQEWGAFVNLAIPGMLMLCIEWWSFEIAGFLAGLISVVELGAQAVIMELIILTVMLPSGFSIAASVRIGNALGARDIEQAKKSYKVALCCTAFVALLVSSVLLALKNVIGYIFTIDKQIIALVSHVMILFAPFHLCDAVNCVCGGILRGIGKPKIGAITNAVGYYLIGLPIGITLMFLVKLGIIGLWTGLLFPVLMQSFIYLPYIIRTNWIQICEEASIRAGIKHQKVLETNTLGEEMCSTGFSSAENGNNSLVSLSK